MGYLIKKLLGHKFPILLLLATWWLFFIITFFRIIEFKSDGLYVGHVNLWSDWSLHIGMINIFAHKEPSQWFAYHPMFAGGKFTYSFLTNLISGLLIRLGFSLKMSIVFPSIIYCLLLILGLYFLIYLLIKSKRIAILTIFIFFLSSGLGFWRFLQESNFIPTISNIIHYSTDFSRIDKFSWGTGNFIIGMFLPQRSFLMGMPIALWSLICLIISLQINKISYIQKRKLLIFGGILAGILPIAHMHSFIVLVFVAGFVCLINRSKWRELIFYIIPAGLISSILYFKFIYGGIETNNFFKFYPGWTAGKNILEWLGMWWQLWGLTIPVAILSLILHFKKINFISKTFFLSLIFIFLLANLFLFQPITWDNSKLFLWSYLGFSCLCSIFIDKLLTKNRLNKIFAIFIFVSLTTTGISELTRISFSGESYQMTSSNDINLGIIIRDNTKYNDIFLTSPEHNHLISMWAARPILLGYTAWVYNYGFDYSQREEDLALMYMGGPVAERLLQQYNISYVFIGDNENLKYNTNIYWYKKKYPVAFIDGQNYIFKVE